MRQLLSRRLKSLDLKELRSIMRDSSYLFQMAASTARRSMVRRARSSAENSDFCAAAGVVVFAAGAGVGDCVHAPAATNQQRQQNTIAAVILIGRSP
jgi:hypothetical protein